MNLSTYQKNLIAKIEKELQHQLKIENPHIDHLSSYYKSFSESIFGGKMLRGLLVCLGYELAGKSLDLNIIKVAASFEILHTSLLIHDDIIDQSSLRRGKPSLHIRLNKKRKGEALALCFGDLGLIWAAQIINNTSFSCENKQKALNFFIQNTKKTIYGQLLDIKLSRSSTKKENDIIAIHTLKTATYSFVAPLGVGALLGGYPEEEIDSLLRYGKSLGIAFQIQDDILGVFGDEKFLGKPVTSDIQEGKNTLLISYAQKYANKEEQEKLAKLYGNSQIQENQCKEIKDIFLKTGAYEYSQKKALKELKIAQQSIKQLTTDQNLQTILYDLSEAAVKRAR